MKPDLVTRVSQIVREWTFIELGEDLDYDFKEQLDSIEKVELILALEDEFEITLPETQWYAHFDSTKVSINTLVEFIKEATNSM